MEYPMATLLKGAGTGVVIHEWMHSWYQMILGTNESLYPWMDEGFTSFAEANVNNYLNGNRDSFLTRMPSMPMLHYPKVISMSRLQLIQITILQIQHIAQMLIQREKSFWNNWDISQEHPLGTAY